MHKAKVMAIFGTRPEAIKMAPVVRQLRQHRNELQTCTVVTAQHRSMLDQVLEIFEIKPDHDLDLMRPGQALTEITARVLSALDDTLRLEKPDLVLVQGDTTTAFAGGLAAYYHQIPIGHVEAGLRTGEKYYPFPEEINRRCCDVLADLCYAPTVTAKDALLTEGIPKEKILVTGNTVIDALLTTVSHQQQFRLPILRKIDFRGPRRTLLVTSHRRENLDAPLQDICKALRDLVIERRDLQLVFPVHLNPKVREVVWSVLGGLERVWLVEPLDYIDFVLLMSRVDLIVTDSGGVQEEAPALGKPVLVIRTTTERPEAVAAGTAQLIGTARKDIVAAVSQLLDDPSAYARMRRAVNPYGDGQAAKRIVASVRQFLDLADTDPIPFFTDQTCAQVMVEQRTTADV